MGSIKDSSTKTCKYCQSEISSKAKICPNCHKKQGKGKLIFFLIVIIIICSVAVFGNSDSNDDTEKFSYTVTKEYDDYFSHYIEGTVVNNRDKDYSYLQIEFICYDTEGNNIGTAVDNTNNLLGKQTWKFKALGLFTDKSVSHCDYHEITGW